MAALSRMPTSSRRLLLEDRDKVARAFIEHLSTYALRRVLTFDDQDDLNAIQTEAKKTITASKTSSAPWRCPN